MLDPSRCTNIHIGKSQEKREKIAKILEERVIENLYIEWKALYIQGAQWILSRIKEVHIVRQCNQTVQRETKESWKQQEKQFVMCKLASIRLTANFSWEIMAIGRQWNDTFTMLKEMSTRNPMFGKISFKKDKTFGMNKNRICY